MYWLDATIHGGSGCSCHVDGRRALNDTCRRLVFLSEFHQAAPATLSVVEYRTIGCHLSVVPYAIITPRLKFTCVTWRDYRRGGGRVPALGAAPSTLSVVEDRTMVVAVCRRK